eukprot:SM000012S25287  [mRNA]  locus=s12:130476:131654:- [translate_table: standard]
MVLWEITLTTAYFLGLRRTYHLVLKLQRRLLKSSPTTRDFVRRRTRGVFQLALGAIKGIQERDISLGRNIGNRVLRFLDRLKPSAQIRKEHKVECKGSAEGAALHHGSPAAVASKEGSLPHHKAPDAGIRSGVTENHLRSSVASRSSAFPSAHVGGLKTGNEIGRTRSQQLQQQQRSLPTMALAGARRAMHDMTCRSSWRSTIQPSSWHCPAPTMADALCTQLLQSHAIWNKDLASRPTRQRLLRSDIARLMS